MIKLIALANLAFCLAIALICILQLPSHAAKRFLSVWLGYTLLLVGSMSSALRPLFWGQWPSYADLIFSGGVLLLLALIFFKGDTHATPNRR